MLVTRVDGHHWLHYSIFFCVQQKKDILKVSWTVNSVFDSYLISSLENGWMDDQLGTPSSVETLEFIRHEPYSTLWVFSSPWVYISCTLNIAVHYGIEWVHSMTSTMVSDTTTNSCPLNTALFEGGWFQTQSKCGIC